MHVADELARSIANTGSCACVGLDPRPSLLPPSLHEAHAARLEDSAAAVASAFVEFNVGIIDAVAGRCAAVKPQVACYEAYGAAGWDALAVTIAAARDADIPVIVDAKRGDVGSTAEHYAQAVFGGAPALNGGTTDGLGGNWVTVNSYLGLDSVRPFLADDFSRGVFVLVKTSNPSSAEVQDLELATGTVSEGVARLVDSWGRGRVGAAGFSDVGAVVGATYPHEARQLRKLMPNTLFLVPGYGAQGGDATSAVAGARRDGTGIVVSASRSIAAAWQAHPSRDWKTAAAAEVDHMNHQLRVALDID